MIRLFAISSLLISLNARAEFFNGPISKAVGGGGRAGLQSMESAFLNPALVPLNNQSDMAAYYHDGYIAEGQHRNAFGLGFLDAQQDVFFPAAGHYFRLRDTGRASGPADGELYHVAGGKNFGDWFSAGVTVYRLSYDVAGDKEYTQWNYSLGVLAILPNNFGLAYVLNNLAKPGGDVPAGLREDLNQAFAIYGPIANLIKVRADLVRLERRNPDHKLTYSLGIESMTSQWFLFRMGFRRDELADQKIWTVGFGFDGPRMRLDYAFEKNAEGTSGAVHSVDMRVPF